MRSMTHWLRLFGFPEDINFEAPLDTLYIYIYIMIHYDTLMHQNLGGSDLHPLFSIFFPVFGVHQSISHPFVIQQLRIHWLKPSLVGVARKLQMAFKHALPSGKHTKSYWKWPFIVDLYPLNMVIFHSYVSLPEGKHYPSTCSNTCAGPVFFRFPRRRTLNPKTLNHPKPS